MLGKQVAVLTSPMKLADQGGSDAPLEVTIHNKGASSVWLGGSNVASSSTHIGYELASTDPQVKVTLYDGDTLWAISANSVRVDVLYGAPGT